MDEWISGCCRRDGLSGSVEEAEKRPRLRDYPSTYFVLDTVYRVSR